MSSRILLFGHGINVILCDARMGPWFQPRLHNFFLPLPQLSLLVVVLAIFKAQESLIPTTLCLRPPPTRLSSVTQQGRNLGVSLPRGHEMGRHPCLNDQVLIGARAKEHRDDLEVTFLARDEQGRCHGAGMYPIHAGGEERSEAGQTRETPRVAWERNEKR